MEYYLNIKIIIFIIKLLKYIILYNFIYMKIIIILGEKILENNKMSNNLIERLKKGALLYKNNDKILVTGGRLQKKVKYTESYYMKKYLINNYKIPEKNIICENKSLNTLENALNSYKILKKLNIFKNIYIISSSYHIKRVKLIFNKIFNELNELNKFKNIKFISTKNKEE
jgi:uncharacterized SAM-binding protein YcdF (DUF218 family)